jgi:hypothetical protein
MFLDRTCYLFNFIINAGLGRDAEGRQRRPVFLNGFMDLIFGVCRGG